MQKKNIKGYIGLFLGLAALICFGASFFIHTEKLTGMGFDGRVSFYGIINLIMALTGTVLSVAAIVFGTLSKRDADKKGPRKPGVILGIIGIVLSLLVGSSVLLLSGITEYINSDGKSGFVASSVKNDKDLRDQMNKVVLNLKINAGIADSTSAFEGSESNSSNSSVSDEGSGGSVKPEDNNTKTEE